MTQTRDGALDALQTVIAAAIAAPAKFYRDPEATIPASHDGVVLMTDGDPGQPEAILSPLSYAWEHQVNFEIAATGENRKATIEALIAKFEPALAADRTLGGAVDDARVTLAPDIHEYPVDGAEQERSAVLFVQLSYTTQSGAN